jgi:Flp pilus assembly protein protease CpaA
MTAFFFPSPALAWAYLVSLMTVLSAASVIDLKTLRIPKSLSLGLLAGGLAASVVRGAWLGLEGHSVWFFRSAGLMLGACDALFLSVCTAIVGFVLFLILWLLGMCGGGDVKLFTATAAWIDPFLAVSIMAFSLSLVCLWIVAAFFGRLISGRMLQVRTSSDGPAAGKARLRGRRVSYSLPLAISTAIVLLASWHGELLPGRGLAPTQPSAELSGAPR